jgi:dihydropteroate synthase
MERLDEWLERRDRALVMGVLNITPDSFYDGGSYSSSGDAIERGLAMVEDGADIIDVGGESSRPGSRPVEADEELARVVPVIEGIKRNSDVLISIDTTKAAVAKAALGIGAAIVNDISAMRFDPEMAGMLASTNAFVVLMHMQGTPETMQINPRYTNTVDEIIDFLRERVEAGVAAGISCTRMMIDPGIGFGKRLEHNIKILRGLGALKRLGLPVLVGLSRKSFLGDILDMPAAERLTATISANAIAVVNGADIIRVHDVKEGRGTADVAFRLRNNAP